MIQGPRVGRFIFWASLVGALEHVLTEANLWDTVVPELERGGGEGIEARVRDRARTRALRGWPRLVRRQKPEYS